MSSVVIAGDTSGTCTLQAPAVAGSTVLTLPAVSGTVMVNGPAFSAYQSVQQTISAATATKLQLQSEEFDTANCFDNVTNYRFTPNVAGYYQVSGGETIGTVACGHLLAIYKNGIAFKRIFASTGGALTDSAYGSCLIYLNGSTDYIELYVQYLGSTNTISASPTNTYFQASMVRSA